MSVTSSIDINNPKQSISSCFKMTHYVVPQFQREYVWEADEVNQLLDDLLDAYRTNREKEYFLGTTVVYRSGDDTLQLIDGQQRYEKEHAKADSFKNLIYTSTTDADGNDQTSFTLELQYKDSTGCLAAIWEDKIPEETGKLPKSSQNIYNAYNEITKKLGQSFDTFDDFKKFAAFFTSRVVFIQIGATNLPDALKIFETINQRGKGLNPMDLLKNLLFMNATKEDFDTLNKQWKGMITKLELMDEKPLRFLRYYLTATYDVSDIKTDYLGILDEDKIYKWLAANDSKCNYKTDPMAFTKDMIDGLTRYDQFLSPSINAAGREYLINIRALMGRSYKLHLVPLLSSTQLQEDLKAPFYKAIEAVVFYSVVNNIKSNVLERLFSSWCPLIRKIRDKDDLKAFFDSNISPTLAIWNRAYRQNFLNLSLATMQRYKIRTILARLHKYADAYRAGGGDDANITEYLKYEIEHIMPQTCEGFEQYGFNSRDEYDLAKEHLGNLTLFEKTLNILASNSPYSAKCKQYENSALYLTKSLAKKSDVTGNNAVARMDQKLKCWADWNQASIIERQEMLCDLSKEVWVVPEL